MNGGGGEGPLEVDRGESPGSALASSPVAGMFDPVGDPLVKRGSGAPRASVQDVALQQGPGSFYDCVVAGGGDASMAPR